MDLTGSIQGITIDYKSKKPIVTLSIDGVITDKLEELSQQEKLNIVLKKHRKKRSSDANAYYWTLVSKIANVLEAGKTEIHNRMLTEYGQPEKDENGNNVIFSILATINLNQYEGLHVANLGDEMVNGQLYTHYSLLRGSHTYNSQEMSVLINGTVSEAKELGIETLPPDELERMVNIWQPKGKQAS